MLLLDMVIFNEELSSIYNIETLIFKKESIKEDVCKLKLNWVGRMILYKKVQLINDRIKEIGVVPSFLTKHTLRQFLETKS